MHCSLRLASLELIAYPEALKSGLAASGLVLHHGADGAPHHARGRTEVEGAFAGVCVLLLPEDRHEEQLVADEAAPVKQVREFLFGYTVVNTQSSSKLALQAYL